MHETLVVHAVLPVESDGLRVVFVKEVVGVHRCVLIAEEAEDAPLLLVVHTAEAELCRLLIGLHQRLCHHEVLHAINSGVREVLRADHSVLLHRLSHLQCGVYEDAVVAVEHLRIHAAHRGADDEIGLFPLTGVLQQLESFLRLYGQVGSYHFCLWQHLTDACHRTALSR